MGPWAENSWDLLGWVHWTWLLFATSRGKLMVGAELYLWEKKKVRWPHQSLLGSRRSPQLHTCRTPRVKGGEVPGHRNSWWPAHYPWDSILTKKMRTHITEALGLVRCEKQNKITGQRKPKAWKNCPQVSGLKHLPGIQEDACTCTPLWGVSYCLTSVLKKLLFVLSRMYSVSNNNRCTCFQSLPPWNMLAFNRGQESGQFCF